jgi:hypothetical protein
MKPKVCQVLPPDARDALVAASRLPDPHERQRAIEAATERAQRRYPQFFKVTPLKEFNK